MLSVGGREKLPASGRVSEASGSADGESDAVSGSAEHPAAKTIKSKTLHKIVQRFILHVLSISSVNRFAFMNQSEANDLFQPLVHHIWLTHTDTSRSMKKEDI